MKSYVFVVLLIIISCNNRNVVTEDVHPQSRVVNKIYSIGDINSDKVNDTAFISYKISTQTNEFECEEADCSINVKFKKNIPDLKFNDSKGIVIKETKDLDNDGVNEIIVFSRTNQGWWNDVSVWSLKNNSWVMLAKTKAFISEEINFDNRIIKMNNDYYLIGHNEFEEDANGNFAEIKIIIK